jgi:hypothetical protein
VETIRHSPLEPDLNHEWKETKWHDHWLLRETLNGLHDLNTSYHLSVIGLL